MTNLHTIRGLTWRSLVAGMIATIAFAATPASAQEFRIIVNSANSTTDISVAALGKIFLKETTAFPNGTNATPVDQVKSSTVRAAFSKKVHGRPTAAVETYWQQQIFSGKDVPPSSKTSDDDVVAFVKASPGAVGYVSVTANTAGVKVIDLK